MSAGESLNDLRDAGQHAERGKRVRLLIDASTELHDAEKRLLLLLISVNTRGEGNYMLPSTMCFRLGWSLRTLKKWRGGLLTLGLVERGEPKHHGRNQRAWYVHLPDRVHKAKGVEAARSAFDVWLIGQRGPKVRGCAPLAGR